MQPVHGALIPLRSACRAGLSMLFSRKKQVDPASRPVQIMHFREGRQVMSEVPCRNVWSAGGGKGKLSHMDPSHVAWALLDASICIPGPRCIGARAGAWCRQAPDGVRPKQEPGARVVHGPRRHPLAHGASPTRPRIEVPDWFQSLMQGTCGQEFMSDVYCGFSYGSRPCSARPESVVFQMNGSPACICIYAAMR